MVLSSKSGVKEIEIHSNTFAVVCSVLGTAQENCAAPWIRKFLSHCGYGGSISADTEDTQFISAS
jgi:hypothetical protein